MKASLERCAFCFTSMLRSKLPWTSVDKVLLFRTTCRVSIDRISCSTDLCEHREFVQTSDRNSRIRMRMQIVLERVLGTRSTGNFISLGKEPYQRHTDTPIPLPVGIPPYWTCFLLSFVHCNSPNPESVNKMRFALLGISHVV